LSPITDLVPLEQLDADGAVRESADALQPATRADFLKRAGIAGGALVGSGAILGALPSLASAKGFTKGDVKILNYALTLEYLEAAFYKDAVARGALSGNVLTFARLVHKHERTHVKTLRNVLGHKAVKSPKFDFKGTTADQAKFLQTSFALENTGVHAYLGQAAHIRNKTLLGAAASIATVEARHAAAVALLLGQITGETGITPSGSFDTGYSMHKVLKIVKGTGFIVG
jgi:ferritin-like protein